jgi:hypothetical protein
MRTSRAASFALLASVATVPCGCKKDDTRPSPTTRIERATTTDDAGLSNEVRDQSGSRSGIQVTFFGSREELDVGSLRGDPMRLAVGDVVRARTWQSGTRPGAYADWVNGVALTRSTQFAVPIPIRAEGTFDFRHHGDPDLLYEAAAGTEVLVGAHMRLRGNPSPSLTAKEKASIRAIRVSGSDAPISLEEFESLELFEITTNQKEAHATGVEAWLDRLPGDLEYLITSDASNADLRRVPRNLVYLHVGVTEGSEETFGSVPGMSSLRWLRITTSGSPKNHGILGLPGGLHSHLGDSDTEEDELSERESSRRIGSLLAGLHRFPSLRSLDVHLGETANLEFTSELPQLVRLVVRGGRNIDLSGLADHPTLKELEVVHGRTPHLPVQPNTKLERVTFRRSTDDTRGLVTSFPNATVVSTHHDRFRFATHRSDEWFIRPARSTPQPEDEPRGLRVPPAAVIRDPSRLEALSKNLELGERAPGKHFEAGHYPMIDFYRSGRLLNMISLASCDTVYLAGEGAFKLSKTSSRVVRPVGRSGNLTSDPTTT